MKTSGFLLLSIVLPASSLWAKGPGVRAGDLVVHPQATLAAGTDSNVYYVSGEDGRDAPKSLYVLKLGGGLGMANRSPNKVALELEGGFTYRHTAGMDPKSTLGSDVAKERNGLETANAGLMVGILPKSSITLELHSDLQFSDRASYEGALGFERVNIAVGPDLRFRPGDRPEARAFEARLGYRARWVDFVDETQNDSGAAEKSSHEMRFLTIWKFLPKTAVLADLTLHVNDYHRTTADTGNRSSTPFKGLVGLRGLVTRRVSAVLKAGYANTFNTEKGSYSGPVGVAQLQYALEPTFMVAAGYKHDVLDTSFANFYVVETLFGKAELYFLRRWTLGGKLGYDYRVFSTDNNPVGVEDERKDPVLRASAGLTYDIREWLAVGVGWKMEIDQTEFRSPSLGFDPDGPGGEPPITAERQISQSYTRHEALLKLSANY